MSSHRRWAAHPILDKIGEERVLDLRASGLSVRQVCEACGVTPRQLYHWLDKGAGANEPGEHGATRRDRWGHANTLCAEAVADGAAAKFGVLRDPSTGRMRLDVTREEIALTAAETKLDQWRASKMDPATFGERGAGTTLNIGTLHLNAVKAVLAKQALPGAVEPIEDADFTEMLAPGGPDEEETDVVHAG